MALRFEYDRPSGLGLGRVEIGQRIEGSGEVFRMILAHPFNERMKFYWLLAQEFPQIRFAGARLAQEKTEQLWAYLTYTGEKIWNLLLNVFGHGDKPRQRWCDPEVISRTHDGL